MPVVRSTDAASLNDVLDRVLDKGIVVDAWARVSQLGIDLTGVEACALVAEPEHAEHTQLERASSVVERGVGDANSELVRHNELLRRQSFGLEQASQLKSQFLANVSHELRTPLNAILGYTSMLLQGIGGELSDDQRKSLQRVDSNGRQLLSLINGILDIAQIEAKKATLELSDFAVPELVLEVVAELKPLIRVPNVELRTELEHDLPLVRGDRQKLKQILLNLLSNALKFTRRGSIVVSASYHPANGELELAVADTGIGIAAEHHSRIFEDFRQVDSSPTREYGGTGLGLALCRRLASLMGAELGLKSELGRGSTFFVRLGGPFLTAEPAKLAAGGTLG